MCLDEDDQGYDELTIKDTIVFMAIVLQRYDLLVFTPLCKTPPYARANSRVRALKIIRCLEVSSLGFKY